MKNLIRKQITFQVKEVDEEKYIIRGVFSTPDVDRHGETIDQKGWKINEYLQNPVILWAHDQWNPAIGQMVELGYDGAGNLAGAIKFAVEEYEFAKTIFNLYKGRFLRAFSVGFRNDKWEVDEQNDITILKENTLFEVSAVNVPANAMALAYSKGIDMQPLVKAIEDYKTQRKRQENKEIIEESLDVISKQIIEKLRNDSSQPKKKVETPKAVGDKCQRIKAINNAIHSLLKEKANLKKLTF